MNDGLNPSQPMSESSPLANEFFATQQPMEIVEHIWLLIRMASHYQARALSERLVQKLADQVNEDNAPDTPLLRELAHAHFVAGYSVSINTYSYEAALAIKHFQAMEQLAQTIKDQTLLNLALTYQGDMYRRKGDLQQARTYLEASQHITPLADAAALGNSLQLLCRVYLQMGDLAQFAYNMSLAEDIAATIQPDTSIMRGQYCLGTVYEEYARSYANIGQSQRALEYLDKAKKALSPLPNWELLLTTTHALVFIKGGEISQGTRIAIEAAQLCHAHGNIRILERIRGLQRFLDKQAVQVKRAAIDLDDALNFASGAGDD